MTEQYTDRRLRIIEDKLDVILVRLETVILLEERVSTLDKRMNSRKEEAEKLETRLTTLETKVVHNTGMAAVISKVMAVIFTTAASAIAYVLVDGSL